MAMTRPGVGIGVFIWKNNKFILLKRKGAHGAGTWSVPGGWLEFGESFEDCAIREAREETDLEIDNIRFLTITNNVFHDEGVHSVTIWLESDYKSGNAKIMEKEKCDQMSWYTFKTLPNPLFLPWKDLKKAKPELFK
jgi:8-oxo-dGTP diphosphatase